MVTTWNGKGAIDETHPLAGQTIGDTGSTIGNALASSADVVLSVGCRFVDWSASSWRAGVTFAIPPTKLIQLEIDPREIGKTYRVDGPARGDARAGLARPVRRARGRGSPRTAYGDEIASLREAWQAQVEVKSGSDAVPMTMARAVREVQAATRPDAIVVTGAGLPQGMVKQRWVTREPRTHITSGGFSTMGFTLPAAIGASLARPEAQVLAVCGDGDFLQSMQELAAAAMLGTPVCTVVLDNSGWISIKGGQQAHFGRSAATDFLRDGEPYSPDFAAIGRAFGIHTESAREPGRGAACGRARAGVGRTVAGVDPGRPRPGRGRSRQDRVVGRAGPRGPPGLRGPAAWSRGAAAPMRVDVGCVPIVWNNVDLPDLGPPVPREDGARRARAHRVRGHAVRPRLSRGRRAPRGPGAALPEAGRVVRQPAGDR